MGTYGTTHIKKADKVIDFTDSHDGYFSWMGKMNFLSIKYVSDAKLAELFNAFTATIEGNDGDEPSLDERSIQNTIFEVMKDSGDSPEAKKWIEDALSDSIRASVTGFAPLMYLNINPGFTDGNPNYVIDLDKREFIFTDYQDENYVFKLDFDTIRQTPQENLIYWSDYFDIGCKLVEKCKSKSIYQKMQKMFESNKAWDVTKFNQLQQEMAGELARVLALDPKKVNGFYEKLEQERQQALRQLEEEDKAMELEYSQAESGVTSFSVHTAKSLPPPQVRKVVMFMQHFVKENPQADFLYTGAEWGMSEDMKQGGIRLLSPSDPAQEGIFRQFIQTLEHQFKIGFNIFSGAGCASFGGDQPVAGMSDWFSVPKLEKSLFTLEELKSMGEGWQTMIDEVEPYIGFHLQYEESRHIVLNKDFTNPYAAIYWIYFGLLNQDGPVVEKLYPMAREFVAQQDEKTQQIVQTALLRSLADGEHIKQLTGSSTLGSEFIASLQKLEFFKDLEHRMTKMEKQKYLLATSSSKIKP